MGSIWAAANLRAAVVRILVGGERALTARFATLASHYLVEPCFCRPGEGHDKGGVEARGKALRRQALVPIPSAPTLAAINTALLARMDARLETGRDVAGHTIGGRFAEETSQFRALPPPFVAEATFSGPAHARVPDHGGPHVHGLRMVWPLRSNLRATHDSDFVTTKAPTFYGTTRPPLA